MCLTPLSSNSSECGAICSSSNIAGLNSPSIPNTIYLPVAFHNNQTAQIQIVGYPQVVIPVAISRSAQTLYSPIIRIDEFMSQNVTIPKTLTIGELKCPLKLSTDRSFSGCANAGLVSTSQTDTIGINTNSSNNKNHRTRAIATLVAGVKRRTSNGDIGLPLDLSLRYKERRTETIKCNEKPGSLEPTNEKSSLTEIEKRYRCECGVSFNSEVTLIGHKKYYCNNSVNHDSVSRETLKKVLNRCHHCDFQPASSSQLAQHVRSNHAVVQAYICKLCGYKGYSQRGIRSHLRTHTEFTMTQSDDFLRDNVQFVTSGTDAGTLTSSSNNLKCCEKKEKRKIHQMTNNSYKLHHHHYDPRDECDSQL